MKSAEESWDQRAASWGSAGLLAGWLHGAGDYLGVAGELPGTIYGAADQLVLFVTLVSVLTFAAGAGAAVAALVFGATRRLAGPRVAALALALVWCLPVWLLNHDLAPRVPLLFWTAMPLGTAAVLAAGGLLASRPPRSGAWLWIKCGAAAVVAVGAWVLNASWLPGLYLSQHATLAYVSLSATVVLPALCLAGQAFRERNATTAGRFASETALHPRYRGLRRLRVPLTLSTAFVWALALGLVPGELRQGPRAQVFAGSVQSARVIDLLSPFLDPDMDGAAAGTDCGWLDPTTHPGARDLPDDGADQDCLGGPAASADIAELLRWRSSWAPRPAPGSTPGARSLVFITVDALRADHAERMQIYRDLSARGVRFERAYAPYPSTILSFYSILTGRAPSAIRTERWVKWDVPVPDPSETLPGRLASTGWQTAGLFFHHIFHPERGITRGFEQVWTASPDPSVVVWGRSSEETADRALRFLEEAARAPRRPFFLWVHFYDPHEPYVRHPEVPVDDPEDLAQLYEGEIRFADRHAMRLLDHMRETGLLERVLLVFAADHGEALGEHGQSFHASTLYEEQVRVPLVVSGPGVPAGVRRREPVSLMDLADTVCEELALPRLAHSQGASFAGLLHGAPAAGRQAAPVFVEVLADEATRRGVVLWPWKLVHNTDDAFFELYHLEKDPGELVNAYDAVPAVAKRLEKLLGTWMAHVTAE